MTWGPLGVQSLCLGSVPRRGRVADQTGPVPCSPGQAPALCPLGVQGNLHPKVLSNPEERRSLWGWNRGIRQKALMGRPSPSPQPRAPGPAHLRRRNLPAQGLPLPRDRCTEACQTFRVYLSKTQFKSGGIQSSR